MKKITAIILALVFVFSLSVTALAAGEEVGEDGNTGVTTVSIVYDEAQISATVPLTVTLAVAADGSVTGPSGYTIKNTSVMPVRVTSVVIAPQSGFALAGSATDTGIGSITLTDGRAGSPVALSVWTANKSTDTAWNLGALESETANMTLSFGGSMAGIIQDITTEKTAFTITYTIAAGVNANVK